ncbi:hypothetical protein IWQ56_007009, partial [Coemansia nantahalensis]
MLARVMFGSAVLAMLTLGRCGGGAPHDAVHVRADSLHFSATHWPEPMALFASENSAAPDDAEPALDSHAEALPASSMAEHFVPDSERNESAVIDRLDPPPAAPDLAEEPSGAGALADSDEDAPSGIMGPNDANDSDDPVDFGGSAAGSPLSLMAAAAVAC